MPRRGKVIRHRTPPDAKYNSVWVQTMINKIMKNGKKGVAERIVYHALDDIGERTKEDPRAVFEKAMRNVMPVLEVRPRRVGGATYQIPLEVRPARQISLAMRWLLGAARSRVGRPMSERLAAELVDAYREQGSAIKKRDDTHKMAEANKAFVHYRW
ncbi:MAG: 30S ribosomal protein S7 [Chloroflexi bacterium]|nr:MAG: 30S ribosomal protein S7 [Chloroflexota bacterium]TMG03281.1 MAG: 30S ribosomal protein S7 [Chloroflexota bacterium]